MGWPRDDFRRAVGRSTLRPLERLVAIAYAEHAGDRPTAWLTLPQLTAWTGMSRDAANRAVRGLVAAGWLVVVTPARQHRATVYRLQIPEGVSADLDDADTSSTSPVLLDQGGQVPSSTSPDTSSTPDDTSSTRGVLNNTSRTRTKNKEHTAPAVTGEAVDPLVAAADRVCEHLADRIEASGSPRPVIDQKWKADARAMLAELDEQLIHGAIDWAHNHVDFWASRIRNPDALRRNFDTMHAQARAEHVTPAQRRREQADAETLATINAYAIAEGRPPYATLADAISGKRAQPGAPVITGEVIRADTPRPAPARTGSTRTIGDLLADLPLDAPTKDGTP